MSFLRMGAAALFVALLALPAAADEAETRVLQQRLADAGCYRGAIDGRTSAALDAAQKACPDMKPFLRIETGMHVATIKRIGVDAACRRLATSSDDKTVRIWSLPDGRLEQTIRLPIGEGNGGKVFAAALSPDGRTLAAGGWDAYWDGREKTALYVVDLASRAVRRLGDLPNVIDAVVFSPDGARAAVGLGRNNGVRVFDIASGAQIASDLDYGADVYGLAFGADGTLFAASYDGRVRRYGPDGKLQAKSDALPGQRPYSVAIRPDGGRLAVGFNDDVKVAILDARTLKPIAVADTKDVLNGDFSSVAWSRDGAVIAAAGKAQAVTNGAWRDFVRRFDADGRRLGADAPAARNTITNVDACGDGFVFASFEPSFGLVGAAGGARTLQGPRVADLRDSVGDAFKVTADGVRVRFGLELRGAKPVLFDLAVATLTDAQAPPADLAATRQDGLKIENWENSFTPTLAGGKITLEAFERSRSFAIRRDGAGFALGTNWYLRAFDAAGKPRWQTPGPGDAWGLNYASDKLLLTAFGDGTVRWQRASDGVELLALFVEPQTRKWVAWTPSGYYMASAGAEDLIGWHLNRGWTQLADFFPASRFAARFNRPDVVQRVLTTLDEAEAVKQADAAASKKPETSALVLPPVVTLATPADNASFSGDVVEIEFDVRSPSGAPIDRIEAQIDGRPVEARGLAPAGDGSAHRKLAIAVPAHDLQISLLAHAGAQTSQAAIMRLHYAGAAKADDALKPKLYVVTIGVSDYADEKLRLGWAAEDARGFAAALQAQKGGLYSEVVVNAPLVDRAVTRTSVVSALRWLRKQVTARDTGMVLIAGHGMTDDGQNYWFLPSDASPSEIDAAGVSQDDLLRELRQVAGKAILFLDTCHANQAAAGGVARRGATDIDGVVNEFSRSENGLVVFSSSRGRETSQESPAWRHGAFTKALIEGLGEGKADLLHNGAITLSELDAYLEDRVKTLTDGEQHPVMVRPPTMPDFAFAVVK